MDYFSKFLRQNATQAPKQVYDHASEFHRSWLLVKETLTHPDERQLSRGINATEVPTALRSMVDSLVWEATRTEEGLTGACMEYLLKNDVLGTLVRLSEPDRPAGIQAEVLRTVQNMVVLLDEQFLVHSVVHRAVLRLLKTCVGDDVREQLDGRNRVMGAAGATARTPPSEYEEDLVDLLCLLCSRIRTFRELLMIFFYDKHWYHADPLTPVPEEDEDEEGIEDDASSSQTTDDSHTSQRPPSPTLSQETVTSAPVSSQMKKPEYEFLLFNYLLRFVHREGKIGDFARAGLLFLMDVAMSPGVPAHRLGESGQHVDISSSSSPASTTDPVADAALALAEYILDGDFCEVLGAGLGAVYSLLPSKLEIRSEPQENASQGAVMAVGALGPLTDEDKEKDALARERAYSEGVWYSSNPEFRARLNHFVKLLEFLQDVLRRNVSESKDDFSVEPASFVGSAIVHSILDAVRRIFLENVLYPSILECSDNDGSAVAVMSYIDVMFRTIQDAQFAEALLDFLVSEDDPDSSRRRPRTKATLQLDGGPSVPPDSSATRAKKVKRRKSSAMMLLEMEAPDARRQSEYLTSMGRFTLKDLLLANMRSHSHATVTSALQLMQSLMQHHCLLTVDRLFIYTTVNVEANLLDHSSQAKHSSDDEDTFVYPGSDAAADPTPRARDSFDTSKIGHYYADASSTMHERELGLYLGLIARIDPTHSKGPFSTGYSYYLKDAIMSVAGHACTLSLSKAIEEKQSRHLLDVNDPVLSSALQSLRHFYVNTPQLNIALTGILATIASCPERSIEGWLVHDKYSTTQSFRPDFSQASEDGDDRSFDYSINEGLRRHEIPAPITRAEINLSRPVVFSVLEGLVASLDRFRELVDNFDSLLSERRQGLVFSENLTDALSLNFDVSSNVTGVTDVSANPRSADADYQPSTVIQKLKPKARSGWASFLSPKRSKSRSSSPAPSSQSSTPAKNNTLEASPFGTHYRKTRDITVEPPVAPIPTSGSWAPADGRRFNTDEEDVFSSFSHWAEERRASTPLQATASDRIGEKSVCLSQILDNIVILEESIKELTAIVHARRSLGIDTLRFF